MAAGALWNEVNDGGSLLLCASHLSSSGSCQKSAPPFPAMHHLTSVTTVLWSPAASGVVSASRSVKKQNRNCVVRTVQKNSLLQPFFEILAGSSRPRSVLLRPSDTSLTAHCAVLTPSLLWHFIDLTRCLCPSALLPFSWRCFSSSRNGLLKYDEQLH